MYKRQPILNETVDQDEVIVGDFFDTNDREYLRDQELCLDIPGSQLLLAIFVPSEQSSSEH